MINRKLTSLICAAALAVSAYGAHDAYAQKGVMFTAQGDWVTKDLASSRKGAKPYCVAAMQYSKNTILTIAENKGGEFSFAFDFGSGYFDPAQPAKVVLDPGAGQQRSYNVKPRSSRAIVVKLGSDRSFMDALEKTGLMRMEIGNQSLNFNLSSIDQGRSKLRECLDGVIVVSAPNAVPPPNQRLQSSNFESSVAYKEMRETYEAQINVLKTKLARAQNAMEAAKVSTPDSNAVPVIASVDAQADSGSMPSSLPSLSSKPQYESLHYDVKRLTQELARVTAERDAAIAAKDKVSDMAAREQVQTGKDKEVAEALMAENKALKAQVQLLEQAGTKEVQSARSGYNKLLSEHDALMAEKVAVEKSLASLRSELVELKANNQKSVTASDLKSKEIDAKFSELLEEKQRIVSLESENMALKSKLTDMEKDFGTQVERLKTELAQLRGSYEGSLVDVERLSKENGTLKAAKLQAEVLQKQTQAASMGESQKLEAEFKELLSEKQKAISLESDNASLRSKLQTLESDYKQQLAGMSTKYEALQKAYDKTRDELTKSSAAIGQLKADLAHLDVEKKKLEAMRSVESGGQGVDVEELLAAKKKAITLEAEKVSLQAQLDSLQSSYEQELGQLKSAQNDREHILRKKELEVAAIRAEAERQLAEARAVKDVRMGKSSAVESSVVDRVASGASSLVSGAADVVEMGVEAVDTVVEDVVPAAVEVASLSPHASQAQRMEAQIVDALALRSQDRVSVVSDNLKALEVVEIPRHSDEAVSVVQQDVVVPAQQELVSVSDVHSVEPMNLLAEDAAPLDVVEQAPRVDLPVVDVASGLFRDMLRGASIDLSRDVSFVSQVSRPDFQAYEWSTAQAYGSAEQKPYLESYGFDNYVLSYLENTQKRCTGEFAIAPAYSEGDGVKRVDSYEVACVGDDVSSAASLLFYAQDGKFTAVAHEAAAEKMDVVLDLRDRLLQALRGRRNG